MQLDPTPSAIPTAAVDERGFAWPLAFMRREQFGKGEFLFKIGDPADRLFYIASGSIHLPELGRGAKTGQVLGEMGIFSPNRSRSASAVAEQDVTTFSMGAEEVRSLMSRDPALATNLIEVVIQRMMEHLKAEAEARERIQAELRIGRSIQASMLPRVFPPFPERTEFEIYAMMEPASEVGGDLYDFFFIDEQNLCALVGDVSGKGVPAALLMARTKTLLRSEAMQRHPPGEILARVNNALCDENQECMFATVLCLVLHTGTGKIECCAAGHNPPLLCSGTERPEYLDVPNGLVLGFEKDVRYASRTLQFAPGDTLFLYTDGVTEAENARHELFCEERLRTSISRRRAMPLQAIVAGVRNDLTEFASGQAQSDDVTLLALRYHGARSRDQG